MAFPYSWLKTAQSALLGPRCVLCHAPAPLALEVCGPCRADLPRLERACVHCALPLQAGVVPDRCTACRRRPRFDRAIAAFHYAAPIDWLIARLKFQRRLHHARLLGDMLGERVVADTQPLAQQLIPVPLHARGYRRRGFNQAERIARRISAITGQPVHADLAVRRRPTEPQSALAAKHRAANVRGAFGVRDKPRADHVAIVDDVMTTAHTAAALARVLHEAGVARVDVYSVARA